MLNLPVGTVAERARWWYYKVDELIRANPELSDQVPEGANLCILPDDDPELARHNLLETEQYVGEVVLVVVTGGSAAPEVIIWNEP